MFVHPSTCHPPTPGNAMHADLFAKVKGHVYEEWLLALDIYKRSGLAEAAQRKKRASSSVTNNRLFADKTEQVRVVKDAIAPFERFLDECRILGPLTAPALAKAVRAARACAVQWAEDNPGAAPGPNEAGLPFVVHILTDSQVSGAAAIGARSALDIDGAKHVAQGIRVAIQYLYLFAKATLSEQTALLVANCVQGVDPRTVERAMRRAAAVAPGPAREAVPSFYLARALEHSSFEFRHNLAASAYDTDEVLRLHVALIVVACATAESRARCADVTVEAVRTAVAGVEAPADGERVQVAAGDTVTLSLFAWQLKDLQLYAGAPGTPSTGSLLGPSKRTVQKRVTRFVYDKYKVLVTRAMLNAMTKVPHDLTKRVVEGDETTEEVCGWMGCNADALQAFRAECSALPDPL